MGVMLPFRVLAKAGTHLRPIVTREPSPSSIYYLVIPAPEPESRGGDLALNPISILTNMVSPWPSCKGL